MPTIVNIPEVGLVRFPDGMDDDAITQASRRLHQQATLPKERAKAERGSRMADAAITGLDWAEAFTRGATPQGLMESAGRVIGYVGDVGAAAAEDVIAGETTPTSLGNLPNPLGQRFSAAVLGRQQAPSAADTPVEQGVVDAGRMLGAVGTSIAAMALRVPPPIAFGAPMAAETYARAKAEGMPDEQALPAAAQAGAVGAVIPGVASAGRAASAKALSSAVQHGWLSGNATAAQKAVEAIGSQGAVQAFIEGINLPNYIEATPEERRDMFIRNLTANTPLFLATDVPYLVRRGPSATQQAMGTKNLASVKVAEVLAEAAKDPIATDALFKVADRALIRAAEHPDGPAGMFQAGRDPLPPETPTRQPAVDQSAPRVEPSRLKGPDAPETVQDAREGAEVVRGGTPVDPPITASSGEIPGAPGPSSPPPPDAAAVPADARGERLRAYRRALDADRPPDVIDWIQNHIGRIRSHRQAPKGVPEYEADDYTQFRKTGWGRKMLTNEGGKAPDVAAQAAFDAGMLREPTAEALWAALETARRQRAHYFKTGGDPKSADLRDMAKQYIAWRKAQTPAASRDMVGADELFVGDTFELQGQKVKVRDVEFDDDGRVTALVLEDGRKFGTQRVEGDAVAMDKGSLDPAPRNTDFLPPEEMEQPGARQEPAPAKPAAAQDAGPFFDKVESVEEQKARLAEEAQAQRRKAEREKLDELATRPLEAGSGDLGQGALFDDPGTTPDIFAPPSAATVASQRRPRGTSGIGRPVAAAPPGPAAPQSGMGPGGLPMSMTPAGPRATRFEKVRQSMEDVVRAAGGESPVRARRFVQRALGIYKPHERVIRLARADDLPTMAHEVAHALADMMWRTKGTSPKKAIPAFVRSELVGLGKALYGTRKPAAGYTEEGFAEFMRLWLTTDDARRLAPRTSGWFDVGFLPSQPGVAKALAAARSQVDTWRGMGAVGRAKSQMRDQPGRIKEKVRAIQRSTGMRGMVEALAPLERMSAAAAKLRGKPMPADLDPYLLATAKRGTAGKVLQNMVRTGMQDIWGNPTGGRSLAEGMAPVVSNLRPGESKNERIQNFWLYMWGRRGVERWREDKNPGLSLADAQWLKDNLATPEFQLAAGNYYDWWDGVLDYAAQSSAGMRRVVENIRAGSQDYVPLARVFEGDPNTQPAGSLGSSNPLRRMHGSARPVADIATQTLVNAERLIAAAHREMVLDAMFRLAQEPGMGSLIERIPADKARKAVNIERIRKQMEDMGVDTSTIPDDTVLNWYEAADRPRGVDPIVLRRTPAGDEWYHVDSQVYDMLDTMQPQRLGWMAEMFLAAPARAFRAGATALRPAFNLVTNPARDFKTYMIQSTMSPNPVRRLAEYLGAMGEIVRATMTGKRGPALEAFERMGVTAGTFLGGDIAEAKREAKSLFHGRLFRTVRSPLESFRELISIPELFPRYAEFRGRARELGWQPGTPLTPEQAVALTVAGKRVTTDFSARGDYGNDPYLQAFVRGVPFANATIQGFRTFGRTLKERPAQAMLYGLSMLTMPALYNWWRNKDEDWYRALPWRERYLYTNVDTGAGEVVRVPRPHEWGNLFMVLPEAMMDLAYRQDPEGMTEAFKHVFETTTPGATPVLGTIVGEQLQNRMWFWDRPIVPRAQQDLPPGEQSGPYTSRMAKWLGDTFPNTISPRRVDHVVRGYFGGAIPDVLAALDFPDKLERRGAQLSDIPVAGTLFRPGGKYSAASQPLSDLYDLHYFWQARARSKANPIEPQDKAYADMIRGVTETIREVQKVVETSNSPDYRRRAYQQLNETATRIVQDAKRNKRFPAGP